MLAIFALSLLAPAAGPTVGLALQPSVGFSDKEVGEVSVELEKELAALGAVVVAAPAVDPPCGPDAGCVERARVVLTDPPAALLVVDLVRVGTVMQLTATGAGGDKEVSANIGFGDKEMKEGPLLPDDVRTWVKAVAPVHVEVDHGAAHEGDKVPAAGGVELTPMQSGALFAGGIGLLALAAGGILVGTSEPVLEDKTSTGPDKEQAVTLGWVGVGSTAAGVVGLAAGAVLYFVLGE